MFNDAIFDRLLANEPDRTGHGCDYCRREISQREPALAKQFYASDAGALFGDRTVHEGPAMYRSATLFSCPRCQSAWLNYYEETSSDLDSEWGERLWRSVALNQEECAAVVAQGRAVEECLAQKKKKMIDFFLGEG